MKSSPGLHFKTFVLIVLAAIFSPLGNVLLSKGMKNVGAVSVRTPNEIFSVFMRVFTSGFIWLGIGCLLLFFVAYLLVLSWADYSYVQPASSVSYGVMAVLGHFFLHEPVTPTRWAGILVICLGVFVVGHTPPRTTEHN
jgi:drug/metabolite transporter (DMT)-like permease